MNLLFSIQASGPKGGYLFSIIGWFQAQEEYRRKQDALRRQQSQGAGEIPSLKDLEYYSYLTEEGLIADCTRPDAKASVYAIFDQNKKLCYIGVSRQVSSENLWLPALPCNSLTLWFHCPFSLKHYKNIPVSVTYGTTSAALGCTWAGYRTLGERVDVLRKLSFSFTILVPIPYVGRLWGWCLVCEMRWNRCTKVWGFILPEGPLSVIMWRCTMSLVQAEPFLKAPEKNGFQKMVPFHLVMTMEKSRTSGKMLWIARHSWQVNAYLVSLPFWTPGRLSSVLFCALQSNAQMNWRMWILIYLTVPSIGS